MKTKLELLKEQHAKGNFLTVIAIAKRFPRLGKYRDAILLAQGCISNPSFYEQLGYNIEETIQAGIKAIEEKYDITKI